jgi:hypothetical protein
MKQVAMYLKHGAEPVRYYADLDTDQLVFEFLVAETKELYSKWLNRELN